MWSVTPLAALLGCLALPAPAADPPDFAEFVVVRRGTVPVILSAPHGGRAALPGVPDRRGEGVEKFVTVLDTNTLELSGKAADAIEKALGGRPYVVAAKFVRRQCDANRPPEGAYEDARARPYYDAYHAALKSHCDEVRKSWGRGLLLDLHGQAAKADTVFRGTQRLTTCGNLKTRFGLAAITGKTSVLGALAASGYTVFPAADAPADAKEDPRFGGGHIVATYGSAGGTNIDAFQLEFGGDSRAAKGLDKTARDLAAALKLFAADYLPREKLPD